MKLKIHNDPPKPTSRLQLLYFWLVTKPSPDDNYLVHLRELYRFLFPPKPYLIKGYVGHTKHDIHREIFDARQDFFSKKIEYLSPLTVQWIPSHDDTVFYQGSPDEKEI